METAEAVERIKSGFNPKTALLIAVVVGGSIALGFSLEQFFAAGFTLDLSLWRRFWPLIVSFLITVSFLTVFSITAKYIWRVGGYALATLGFGFPFFMAPHAVVMPQPFPFLIPLVFLGGVLLFDYFARRAVRTYSIFTSRMFTSAYARFFFLFALVVGILVYFSAQLPAGTQFKVPEEMLNPALNLVVNQVIEQVQAQLGTVEFTEKEFIDQLRKSGLLEVLEAQFQISLEEGEIGTPEKLAENLREPLAEQLTGDLEGLLEPYLSFLPLAAAVGVALSLLFLTPIFSWLSVAAFALVYRGLILARFAQLVEEQRSVPVLKID